MAIWNLAYSESVKKTKERSEKSKGARHRVWKQRWRSEPGSLSFEIQQLGSVMLMLLGVQSRANNFFRLTKKLSQRKCFSMGKIARMPFTVKIGIFYTLPWSIRTNFLWQTLISTKTRHTFQCWEEYHIWSKAVIYGISMHFLERKCCNSPNTLAPNPRLSLCDTQQSIGADKAGRRELEEGGKEGQQVVGHERRDPDQIRMQEWNSHHNNGMKWI